MSLIRQDLGLALDLAHRHQLSPPASEAAYAVLDDATAAGHGQEDMAQVLAALRTRQAGLTVPEGTYESRSDDMSTRTISPSSGAEAEVAETNRALEDARHQAVSTGDIDAFTALAHPDLACTHSGAVVDTLDSYQDKLRSGCYQYHRVDHPIDPILVTGDTAVVLGQTHADNTAGGQARSLANLPMAVRVRENVRRLLLGFQPTVRPEVAR